VEKEYGSIQTYLKQALAIDQLSLQAMNNQFLKG
ncbi:protein-tyrosine-phosphatase, partial [Bifidobacterium longum]|nr:protein-tyrosine-phosphatase [Bifidobacterium longum]